MRLFTAINFNEETVSGLLSLQDVLRTRSERGRFPASDNLHLTLVFLGECDEEQTAKAAGAMDKIRFAPFPISIERVGRFKRDRGALWWAGVAESKPLMDLQQTLTDQLTALGFTLEKRKYTPHITLGRDIITDDAPWMIEPFGEMVYKIELMKSEQIGGKLTYTPIYQKNSIE